ncbi:uncharacterized protein G2W53_039953 [Senna tora]|uniref:Uncharacterized protein n=1 Tax=Senna tora TaxID=362788 RepID=A0A834SQB7_9FABA|nr:uncharacterized protein G2W53_039953 [Senna tora]
MAIHVVDHRETDSDGLETFREASLCHRDHFDSAYAREILPRKKVDPWVIDFGWTTIHVVDHRATDSDGLETSWEASLCHRLHFDPSHARIILTHHMHVRFCLEKNLTHDSLIFDGRRSTRSTAGRPTRMALKLLGRLPCVMGIILTQHLHVRFCLEKKRSPKHGGGLRRPSVVAGHRGATSQGLRPRDHPHDLWASMGHGVKGEHAWHMTSKGSTTTTPLKSLFHF